MPRRLHLPAQLLNDQPAPSGAPKTRPLGDPVWVTAVWLVEDEERVEQIPARLVQRVGDLVLCAWFEPRAEGDQFWFLDHDVRPRDVSGGPAVVDPNVYRYPQRAKSSARDAD